MSDIPTEAEAIAAGREGMERVAANSGAAWQASAFECFRQYATTHSEFMSEDVVAIAHPNLVPEPHDRRAWGAVSTRAQKENIVEMKSYGRAKTGHGCPRYTWRSLVFDPNVIDDMDFI